MVAWRANHELAERDGLHARACASAPRILACGKHLSNKVPHNKGYYTPPSTARHVQRWGSRHDKKALSSVKNWVTHPICPQIDLPSFRSPGLLQISSNIGTAFLFVTLVPRFCLSSCAPLCFDDEQKNTSCHEENSNTVRKFYLFLHDSPCRVSK